MSEKNGVNLWKKVHYDLETDPDVDRYCYDQF